MKRDPRPPLGPSVTLRPVDPRWPSRLCDLADPPAQIEIAGLLPDFGAAPVAALVGTRHPDRRALAFTAALSHALCDAGWTIVSGGALGIDAEAHRAALDAGGTTWAVLGTPLARPYPVANLGLFRRMLRSGAVLAEHPRGSAVYRSRFLERNRLIAALADVVIVLQAPIASGALSTAAVATKLGRRVLSVPHAADDPRGEGCQMLLSQGAGICRSSADVLSLAPAAPRKRPAKNPRRPDKAKAFQGLDEDEKAVADALVERVLTADELCEVVNLSAARVQRALLMLMLSKVIHEVGSGRYERCDYP